MDRAELLEKRRSLREHEFKLVYLSAFNDEDVMPEQIDLYFKGLETELPEEDRTNLKDRYFEIAKKIPEIDEKLNGVARGWKTSRFASCDLAILRLAVYEILYDDRIPEKVAINEAVELAKGYGGDESPAFVNGLLGEITRHHES